MKTPRHKTPFPALLAFAILLAGLAVPVHAQLYTLDKTIGGRATPVASDGPPGTFDTIVGIALDGNENLYVAGYASVQKFDPKGRFLLRFGGQGSGNGQFVSGIGGIAVDQAGGVYLSDIMGHRVQKFSSRGEFLSTFGTPGKGKGQFDQPYGMATDRAGNLYVIDARNRRVQKFNPSGRFLSAIEPGAGDVRPTVNSIARTTPTSVAVDTNGYVYVAFDGTASVQKYNPLGKPLHRVAGLDTYLRVATDKTGNLYVADATVCRVQVFSPKGVLLSKFRAPDPKVGVMPSGLAPDAKGDIYVAVYGNGMAYVRKFRRRYLAP
jgi:sugar lactone lactonase YvrE